MFKIKINKNGKAIVILLIVAVLALFSIFLLIYMNNDIHEDGFETSNNYPSTQEPINQNIKPFIENLSVLLVVRNQEAEIPEDLNLPRATIVQRYLYDCAQLEISKRAECMDEYYSNTYDSLKQKRQECNTQDETCMNNYYLAASEFGGKDYCYAITDESIKQQCTMME